MSANKHRVIVLQNNDRPSLEESTLSTSSSSMAATEISGSGVPVTETVPGTTVITGVSGSATGDSTNPDPCACDQADCSHYVGVPYPNLLGRNVSVDCCCDLLKYPETTITVTARRSVVYTPCENPPNCNCESSYPPDWCACPGFTEEFSGTGLASDPYIVLNGTVTYGDCSPQGGYTMAATMSCGGSTTIDDLNYSPSSFDPSYVTGNYTVSCNRFTMSFTVTFPSNPVAVQTTYLDFSWNHNNGRCCGA